MTSLMLFRIQILIVLSVSIQLLKTSGFGRRPTARDHILCKVKLYNELEDIQETRDPRARVEAYFVSCIHGI